jgi:hypothetical protein
MAYYMMINLIWNLLFYYFVIFINFVKFSNFIILLMHNDVNYVFLHECQTTTMTMILGTSYLFILDLRLRIRLRHRLSAPQYTVHHL